MTTGWLKADVWSLGCTVVEMITGTLPYSYYDNPMTAMYHIASGEVPSFRDLEVSKSLKDFVIACCSTDPTCRPTVQELKDFEFVASFTQPSMKPPLGNDADRGSSAETKTDGSNIHMHEGNNSMGMDLSTCLDDSMGSDAKSQKPPKPILRLVTPLIIEDSPTLSLFTSNSSSGKCHGQIDDINENDVVPNAALQLQQHIKLQDASTPVTTARKGLYNNDQSSGRGRIPHKPNYRPPPPHQNLSGKHSARSDSNNKVSSLSYKQRSNNSSLSASPHTSAKLIYIPQRNRPVSRSESKAATPDCSVRIRNSNTLSPVRVDAVEKVKSSDRKIEAEDTTKQTRVITNTNPESDPTFTSSGEMTLESELTESGEKGDISFPNTSPLTSEINKIVREGRIEPEKIPVKIPKKIPEKIPENVPKTISKNDSLSSPPVSQGNVLCSPQKEELVTEAIKTSPKAPVPSYSLFDLSPEQLSKKLYKMKSDLSQGLSRQSSMREDEESLRNKDSDTSVSWGSTILIEAQKRDQGSIQNDQVRPTAPQSLEMKKISEQNLLGRFGSLELFDIFPGGSLSNKSIPGERLSTVSERCNDYEVSMSPQKATLEDQETSFSEKRERYGPSGAASVRMNAMKESEALARKKDSPLGKSRISGSVSHSALDNGRTSSTARVKKSKNDKAYKLNFDGISNAMKTYAQAVGGDTEYSLSPTLSFRSQSAGVLQSTHGTALDGSIGNQSLSQAQSQGFLGSFGGAGAFRQEKGPRSQGTVSMSYPKSIGANLSQHLLPAINLMLPLPLQRRIIQSAPSLSRSVNLPPIENVSGETASMGSKSKNG